jgi:hypothetical protein
MEMNSTLAAAWDGGALASMARRSMGRDSAAGAGRAASFHSAQPEARSRYFRTHSPVAAVPGVAHLTPSLAPLAQTKDTSVSSS